MYVYCVRQLGLDVEKVNVNGGAIALGHPLDECTLAFVFLLVLTNGDFRGDHAALVPGRLQLD